MRISLARFRQLSLIIITTTCLSSCQHDQSIPTRTQLTETSVKSAAVSPLVSQDFSAHWLTPELLLLPEDNLHQQHTLTFDNGEHIEKATLTPFTGEINRLLIPKHLRSFNVFEVKLATNKIKKALKNKIYVSSASKGTNSKHTAQVQTAQLLDFLFTSQNNDANELKNLGATLSKDSIEFALWAPTAKQVTLLAFNKDKQATHVVPLKEDSNTGIWSGAVMNTQQEVYYQYQLTIYHPASDKIETLTTTDPYSLSLSTNSEYSHVINLADSKNKPNGWELQQDVLIKNPEDNIFYETHIRDFSAHDPQLSSPAVRGKYAAFSEKNSAGIKHFKDLQKAGINNIHLLPTFDIGTANENETQVIDLNNPISKLCQLVPEHKLCGLEDQAMTIQEYLETLPSATQERQAIVSSLREIDNYNWGYDPFHYTVPEGSYAQNPEGSARIIEFRQMVQSIHNLGFRVIMDVVYNHTHQAGLAPTAVLDKIVPNYYHRLDPISGKIAQSTCCDNTATENVMMEKLMTDSLVVWARDYKIDGFRFDLMAHQPKSAMLKAKKAVQAVDKDTYFYGEGWNFGEVANNQRFTQASQLALAGTEIGTFTDRLRDAVRGGAFSASGDDIRKSQGIGSGLSTMPNELVDRVASRKAYLLAADQLRIGLAANLANFPLKNAQDKHVTGKEIPYGDQPTGYALDPADTINYVSKHDNQTLWDNNQYRLPFNTSTKDRVRIHLQSLSFAIFAQGIPFLHMGSEFLRSKSFLRDSYDYGDWFNKVDFTKQSNNYNVGLPPADKDQANWPLIKKVLAKNEGRDIVGPTDIEFSAEVFKEFISLRMSTPLFRLTNSEQIIKRVKFHNTGKEQQIGLIVMSIDDDEKYQQVDADISALVVIFNTSTTAKTIPFKEAAQYQLHPIQQQGVDSVVKESTSNENSFFVPALTTSVFIKEQ
ncbi:pullulanase-type alpha-1,6-glucosidase [Colwellia sp. BRX8-7]|uniref:pullulanase-type alpha-1,6-glucosidase n=1 Tax=Colwellia sp. BRX8-7 TaxID=2759833 RepID=UPI0015F745EA|nr:pullulanase-type alpha-1,6-glucosidase [Colwellia sp. BRX8-7]MBA6337713.1 pullulanase-type alpha-1,6-glucosidase [Colwellia sp. BRX8-7]